MMKVSTRQRWLSLLLAFLLVLSLAPTALLAEGGQTVALVKPQFEAGREKVGKKGVVREPAVHLEVLEQFLRHAAQADFSVKGLDFSPIRGPEGNIEYLGYLRAGAGEDGSFDLPDLVRQSHETLKAEGEQHEGGA